jgi:hypothetical protein
MVVLSAVVPFAVVLSSVTACGSGSSAATEPTDTPASTAFPLRDVQYLPDRTLDVYLPDDGNGPFPTVLMIHAAYLIKSDYAQLAERLAENGYAVVPISWQVSKKVVDDTFCIATIYRVPRGKVDELCETLIVTPFQSWRDRGASSRS